MASRVNQILDALIALLQPALPDVDFARGRAALRTHTKIPRVVFVRTRDQTKDAEQREDGIVTVSTLETTIEAHIIAAEDMAEDIQHCIIAASHKFAVSSFRVGDTTWTLPDNATLGELAVMELRFNVPVIDFDEAQIDRENAVVDTVTHSTGEGTPGDGILECDEP